MGKHGASNRVVKASPDAAVVTEGGVFDDEFVGTESADEDQLLAAAGIEVDEPGPDDEYGEEEPDQGLVL